MPYVDGFVLAVPKDKIEAYKALAHKACAVWMKHGALDCVECIGDDVPYGELTSFPRAVIAKTAMPSATRRWRGSHGDSIFERSGFRFA